MKANRAKRFKMWSENPYCYVCDELIKCFNQSSLEHIIPVSEGGSNKSYNLSISHKRCNSIKANYILRDDWKRKLKEDFLKRALKKGSQVPIADSLSHL